MSISQAVPVLKNNLDEICTVQEWADYMDYSRAHFTVLVKEELDTSPYEVIKRLKYRKVKQLVRENPDCKGRVIGAKVGFSNVKTLYKFLRLHYDTTLTAMRSQCKYKG